MGSVQIKYSSTIAYSDLVKKLRRHAEGKELRRELNRRIQVAAAPAVASVQAAVMGVEVSSSGRGGKSSGLRRRVAAATGAVALSNGVRIRVSGKKVDPKYGRSLSRYLDDTTGRPWVHPVFGNQEKQATQKGQRFFAPSIEKHADKFRAGVEQAIADTIRKIES